MTAALQGESRSTSCFTASLHGVGLEPLSHKLPKDGGESPLAGESMGCKTHSCAAVTPSYGEHCPHADLFHCRTVVVSLHIKADLCASMPQLLEIPGPFETCWEMSWRGQISAEGITPSHPPPSGPWWNEKMTLCKRQSIQIFPGDCCLLQLSVTPLGWKPRAALDLRPVVPVITQGGTITETP